MKQNGDKKDDIKKYNNEFFLFYRMELVFNPICDAT